MLSIPPPKSFKKKKHIGSGLSITCCTTQADNFSAIASYFITFSFFIHLAPPSKFQLFGFSK
jgi:hypothetical protein